jgi:hypothetical protein
MNRPVAVALLLAPAALPAQQERVVIDHVILATDNLGRDTVALRQRTGIAPAWGGRHPGRGTQNALIGLGAPTYLELLAPVTPGDSLAASMGLVGLGGIVAYGWAIGTTDIVATTARLRAAGITVGAAAAGSRQTPDGGTLRWKAAGIQGPQGVTPFLIEWDPTAVHPARTAPEGCRLRSLTATLTTPSTVERVGLVLGLPVAVSRADRDGLSVELDCPSGRQRFSR